MKALVVEFAHGGRDRAACVGMCSVARDRR
jgi:hypothetical protein